MSQRSSKLNKQMCFALGRAYGGDCWLVEQALCLMESPKMQFRGFGVYPDAVSLDHMIPVVFAGAKHPENLRLAHRYCNNTRPSILPSNAAEIEEKILQNPWVSAFTSLGLQLYGLHTLNDPTINFCARCGTGLKNDESNLTKTICYLCHLKRRHIFGQVRRVSQGYPPQPFDIHSFDEQTKKLLYVE